eukprot:s4279_g3.t1
MAGLGAAWQCIASASNEELISSASSLGKLQAILIATCITHGVYDAEHAPRRDASHAASTERCTACLGGACGPSTRTAISRPAGIVHSGPASAPQISLEHDYNQLALRVFAVCLGLREEVREAPGLQSRVTSLEKMLGVFKTCLARVLKSLASPVSLWLKLALRDKRVV